jgi:hypothetical protein
VADGTTVREIRRLGWKGLRTSDEVDGALAVLESHHWLRVEQVASGPQGGNPSEIVRLNPKLKVSETPWKPHCRNCRNRSEEDSSVLAVPRLGVSGESLQGNGPSDVFQPTCRQCGSLALRGRPSDAWLTCDHCAATERRGLL